MRKIPQQILALLWLLAQFCTTSAAGEPRITNLKPDPDHSFATVTAGQFVVGIVGEGWAIRFTAPREQALLATGVLKTGEVSFIRGPLLDQYIRASAGPPTPPLPLKDDYSVVPIGNITITSLGAGNPEQVGAVLELSLSRFVIGEQWFVVLGNVRLPLRGPLP